MFDLTACDYEFCVPRVLGTTFLVREFDASGHNRYTTNIYEADLADPKAVAEPATEGAWDSGTPVPLRHTGPAEALGKFIQSTGFQFATSGKHAEEVVRVSPDRAVLIDQSWSGTLGPSGGSDVPGDFSISLKFGNAHGKPFFDAYSSDTDNKLVTIDASFVGTLPEEIFDRRGWVTERISSCRSINGGSDA